MEDVRPSIDVIINDLKGNPSCPHGPTILYSRRAGDSKTNFFACSAYRDRKYCTFFMFEDQKHRKVSSSKKEAWKQERLKFLNNVNHRKLFLALNKIQNSSVEERIYCHTCSKLDVIKFKEKHKYHNLKENISDYFLKNPSEMLIPLDTSKKEAQYLFSKNAVEEFVAILEQLGYKKIICIGTPRIHEFINTKCPNMNSLLLDMDSRFHNFFGPLEFCWYNMFNNHFFFEEAKNVFRDFLESDKPSDVALITDPPFGGRVEPLAHTFRVINEEFKSLNNVSFDLPTFWIFPYFMEPHIVNYSSNFTMIDYRVDYENHDTFSEGRKGRKQGSPVRIFTNVDPSLIKLPEHDYKFCKKCKRWVSKQNSHCDDCKSCTSKDGSTYVHCNICDRCVKPTWQHCKICNRCALVDHNCQKFEFLKDCFYCKQKGHKKSECPEFASKNKSNKIKKIKIHQTKRI